PPSGVKAPGGGAARYNRAKVAGGQVQRCAPRYSPPGTSAALQRGQTMSDSDTEMQRDTMEVDVVVVGAGPAGLATACRLMQLAADGGREISVVVLEKGAEVGAHILSGAVIQTRALDELFPDRADRGAPLDTPVTA